MQEFYDYYLPGNSTTNLCFDNFIVHTSDLNIGIEDSVLDISKSNIVTHQPMKIIPKLRTAMEVKRRPGLTENILAMIKRNFNSPELMSVADNEVLAKKVVDNLFSTVLTGSYDSNLVPSLQDFEDWMSRQEPATLGQLKNVKTMSAVDSYKHIIKETPKAKLDKSIQQEYPALQTIIYHEKDINAIFGPIFSFLTERLLEIVDTTRFLFYTRKTTDDLEKFFSDVNPKSDLEVMELDVSKYDKSQNDFHQAVEMMIWDRLGLDAILGEIWRRGHQYTTIKDFKAGIRTKLWYQRKSGDVTTFIGNTLIIASCMASITNLGACVKAAFCGDDSIVYFPKGLKHTHTMELAALQWNFNAKLLMKKTGYFCGKFILLHPSGCKIVPDPLKVITRLGNKNLKDMDHVEEMRVSLMDNCKSYGNSAYTHLLDDAFNEVYSGGGTCQYVLNCLWKIITDKNNFAKLFEVNKEIEDGTKGGKERRGAFKSTPDSSQQGPAKGVSETRHLQRVEGKIGSQQSEVQAGNFRYCFQHERGWGDFPGRFKRDW